MARCQVMSIEPQHLHAWRAQTPPVDRAKLTDILVNKVRLKRAPVAISYCDGLPPAGYAASRVPVCAIVHQAEQGKHVYVNADAHDCHVGQFHLGFLPHEQAGALICDGEYLTMAQGFFTPRAAKINKHTSHTLPVGALSAIAAAPLAGLPADAPLDLVVCITDVQRAMQLAGAASVRDGQFPHGELGPSSCSSLFAAPWLTNNTVFALGEGGGRGFNAVASGEMFIALPAHHLHYIIEMFENFWFKPEAMRERIFPSHAATDKSNTD
jgi:uncharacterized protein (DUF169 family)